MQDKDNRRASGSTHPGQESKRGGGMELACDYSQNGKSKQQPLDKETFPTRQRCLHRRLRAPASPVYPRTQEESGAGCEPACTSSV